MWVFAAVSASARVVVEVGGPRLLQDCVYGRHAGDDDEEVGFDQAPIDGRGIIVCGSKVSNPSGRWQLGGTYRLGLKSGRTGPKHAVGRS